MVLYIVFAMKTPTAYLLRIKDWAEPFDYGIILLHLDVP
jgi:hypothetical protein